MATASLIVSIVAVAVAAAFAVVTYRHGKRLADVEAGRRSDELAADMYVYVARRTRVRALLADEAVSCTTSAELCIHNRGHADADSVDVFFTADGDEPSEASFPRIAQGEDVCVATWRIEGGAPCVVPLRYSVQWFDRRGPQALTNTVHEFTELERC